MAETLRDWINPKYLTVEAVRKIALAFMNEGAIQLSDFLLPERYTKLMSARYSFTHAYHPQQYSYDSAEMPRSVHDFLASSAFSEYVEILTGYRRLIPEQILRLKHRDYTALYDHKPFTGLGVALSLTPRWDYRWGGVLVYKHSTGDALEVVPKPNTLTMALCSSEVQSYISYVNHCAKGSVLLLTAHARNRRADH